MVSAQLLHQWQYTEVISGLISYVKGKFMVLVTVENVCCLYTIIECYFKQVQHLEMNLRITDH